MPTPTRVADGGYASSTGATVSLPLPAGIQNGDLLLMFASVTATSSNLTVTPPAGWQQLINVQGSVAYLNLIVNCYIFWRAANNETGPYTVSGAASAGYAGIEGNIRAYRGANTSSPMNSFASSTTETGFVSVVPALTETFKSGELYVVWGADLSNNAVTGWSPATNAADNYYNIGVNNSYTITDYAPAGPGAPGSMTITWGTSNNPNVNNTISIGFTILPTQPVVPLLAATKVKGSGAYGNIPGALHCAMIARSKTASQSSAIASLISHFVAFISLSRAASRSVSTAAGRIIVSGSPSAVAAKTLSRLAGVVTWTRFYLADGFSIWATGPGTPAMFGLAISRGVLDTRFQLIARAISRGRGSVAFSSILAKFSGRSESSSVGRVIFVGSSRMLFGSSILAFAARTAIGASGIMDTASSLSIAKMIAVVTGRASAATISDSISIGGTFVSGRYFTTSRSITSTSSKTSGRFTMIGSIIANSAPSGRIATPIGKLSIGILSRSSARIVSSILGGLFRVQAVSRSASFSSSIVTRIVNALLMAIFGSVSSRAFSSPQLAMTISARVLSAVRAAASHTGRVSINLSSMAAAIDIAVLTSMSNIAALAAISAGRSTVRVPIRAAFMIASLRSSSTTRTVVLMIQRCRLVASSLSQARDTLLLSIGTLKIVFSAISASSGLASTIAGRMSGVKIPSIATARSIGSTLRGGAKIKLISSIISTSSAGTAYAASFLTRVIGSATSIASWSGTTAQRAITILIARSTLRNLAAPIAPMAVRSIAASVTAMRLRPLLATPLIAIGSAMGLSLEIKDNRFVFQPAFIFKASAISRASARAAGVSYKFAVLLALSRSSLTLSLKAGSGLLSMRAIAAAVTRISTRIAGTHNLLAAISLFGAKSTLSRAAAPPAPTIIEVNTVLQPIIMVGAILVQNEDTEN